MRYIDEFRNARDLADRDAERLLDALIIEDDESRLADLFVAWNDKGIAADEIYHLARVMRERCTPVRTKHVTYVDIVGTGGSRCKTFNVSTAAAFVVAGAGVPVAKHGNKAATSNSGSADVLAALGIEPAVDAATAEKCLDEIGMCFMFAPNFHRLSPTLAKVRRSLGFPTIFNCVGPLCNPASAPHQLIGVWSEEMVSKMANALSRLGTKRSRVVHGCDGLDEISLRSTTRVAEVKGETIDEFEIEPSEFGLAMDSLGDLRVESVEESAALIREVLEGKREGAPAENLVLMNASAALQVSGQARTAVDGVSIARKSIRSGAAIEKLKKLAKAVRT
jgi:anthranilate phosphoribosyltransferase